MEAHIKRESFKCLELAIKADQRKTKFGFESKPEDRGKGVKP
jgi:hypothetical protein